MHNNLSANTKRKIVSIHEKSKALALPLQVLQVRPYRVLYVALVEKEKHSVPVTV